MLLHVSFDSARHAPRVPAAKHSSQAIVSFHRCALDLCVYVICLCKIMPLCFEKSGIINKWLNVQTFKLELIANRRAITLNNNSLNKNSI